MGALPRPAVLLLVLLTVPPAWAQSTAAALDRIFGDYEQAYLALNPHDATRRGDRRYDDVLADQISDDFLARELALVLRSLERLDALTGDLTPVQQTSVATLRFNLELLRDRHRSGIAAKQALLPISQFRGLHLELAQFGSGSGVQPFADAQDHERWLRRAAQWPAWVDQAIANMRRGIAVGVVLPRVLAERVLPQLEAHIVGDAEQSVFYAPVKALPEGPLRDALAPRYRALIATGIVPGYRKLRDFMVSEYLPASRASVARSALPGGADWYLMDIRANTTLALSAEQIHQTGLAQIALLHREMDQVRERLGFEGSLREFFDHLRSSDSYLHASADAALAAYRAVKPLVGERLPQVFGRIPRADYEVRPVEAFRAASAAGGSYQRPDAAGARPGVFYLNTFDLTRIPGFETMSLSLHEAAPGHHFQLSLAGESTQLPEFQRFGSITAFTEGWALYAETLGREMKLYEDPLQYLGFLHNRLYRANRLVIDTGLHAFGWSRERAIRQFLDNSTVSAADARAETERYIALPGQALAYLIGALEIERLREQAQTSLGGRFDLRAFHDEVLADGVVPLPVVRAKVERWMAQQARATPG